MALCVTNNIDCGIGFSYGGVRAVSWIGYQPNRYVWRFCGLYDCVVFSHVIVVLAVANLLCEFLEVAFHYILYIREIYSPLLFERARKYNTAVQVCVCVCVRACMWVCVCVHVRIDIIYNIYDVSVCACECVCTFVYIVAYWLYTWNITLNRFADTLSLISTSNKSYMVYHR